jgi:hypothetical protein
MPRLGHPAPRRCPPVPQLLWMGRASETPTVTPRAGMPIPAQTRGHRPGTPLRPGATKPSTQPQEKKGSLPESLVPAPALASEREPFRLSRSA